MATPTIASRTPFAVAVDAGQTVYWCACGRSAKQPFCDGSHKGSELSPLKHVCEAAATLWFCGCKQTRTPPFCDGSHKAIKDDTP